MKKEEELDENEINTKKSSKKNAHKTGRKKKGKTIKKEKTKEKTEKKKTKNLEELDELEQSYECLDNVDECISHLQAYYDSLKVIDLENIITKKKIKIFQNINPKENGF